MKRNGLTKAYIKPLPEGAVMQGEALTEYILPRKFSDHEKNGLEEASHVRRVVIFNGYDHTEVEEAIFVVTPHFSALNPPKSLETYYLDDETLYIPNTRDFIRLQREYDQIAGLGQLLGKEIEVYVKHKGGSAEEAKKHFRNQAYAVIDRLITQETREQIKNEGRMRVLAGPLESVDVTHYSTHAEEDTYLDSQIIRHRNETIFHLGYLFGDQAKEITTYLIDKLIGIGADDGKLIDLDLFHYGKVGDLENNSLGSIYIPQLGYNERGFINGKTHLINLRNNIDVLQQLFPQARLCHTVNSDSVLRQEKKTLEHIAQEIKKTHPEHGSAIEMEWVPFASALMNTDPSMGKVNAHFVGITSDTPLHGTTLGDNKYPKDIEEIIANKALEYLFSL